MRARSLPPASSAMSPTVTSVSSGMVSISSESSSLAARRLAPFSVTTRYRFSRDATSSGSAGSAAMGSSARMVGLRLTQPWYSSGSSMRARSFPPASSAISPTVTSVSSGMGSISSESSSLATRRLAPFSVTTRYRFRSDGAAGFGGGSLSSSSMIVGLRLTQPWYSSGSSMRARSLPPATSAISPTATSVPSGMGSISSDSSSLATRRLAPFSVTTL
mmetsp:Transcript_22982/g.71456  ORF Transcript_22982/g.71456 Transcript_22982/m.71456 type:complete len:218 (-) Transcript_22982:92-745(-)